MSLVILFPASLISLVIELLVLSTILSSDSSILWSTESEAVVPKLVTSSIKESNTVAEVVGKMLPISVENIMPPKITIPAIMPNFISISYNSKKRILDSN